MCARTWIPSLSLALAPFLSLFLFPVFLLNYFALLSIFTVHEYTRVYLVSSVAMTIITCVWLTISMCVYIYIYVLLIMSVTHFEFLRIREYACEQKNTEETDHEYDGDKKWWEDIDWGPLANFGDKLWRVPADCCDVIKSKWVHDASIWPFYCQYDPQICFFSVLFSAAFDETDKYMEFGVWMPLRRVCRLSSSWSFSFPPSQTATVQLYICLPDNKHRTWKTTLQWDAGEKMIQMACRKNKINIQRSNWTKPLFLCVREKWCECVPQGISNMDSVFPKINTECCVTMCWYYSICLSNWICFIYLVS